jgi:hypothetical protein
MPKSRKRKSKAAEPGGFRTTHVRGSWPVKGTPGSSWGTRSGLVLVATTVGDHCELCALSAQAKSSGVAMDTGKVVAALARLGTAVEFEG